MAHSSRRSRRLKAGANQQLISFVVRGEQFAVPVGLVEKVVTVNHIYGGLDANRPGLTMYSGQQISVVNLGERLFMTAPPPLIEATHVSLQPPVLRYLLIVPSPAHELVGLLVETQPTLIRVPTSAFSPVPATYLHGGQVRYVGAVIDLQAALVFLINISELLQPQPSSLPAASLPGSAEAGPRALGPASVDSGMRRLLSSPPEI